MGPLVVATVVLVLATGARAQELLYGCGGNGSQPDARGALFLVDPATGAQTAVDDPITPGGLSGLAFDASGTLYGSTIFGSGTTSTLVRIDPVTGALLETIGPITVAGEGAISVGDLALQPGTGQLWAVRSFADEQERGGEIYRLDPASGAATFLGQTVLSVASAIAFAPDGTLYQAAETPGDDRIQRVDPQTFAVLEGKPFEAFLDGLAVRPSDGALFATGLGGLHRIDFAAGSFVTVIEELPLGSMSDLAFLPEPGALGAGLAVLVALAWAGRRPRARRLSARLPRSRA